MKRKTVKILSKTYQGQVYFDRKKVPIIRMGGLWLKQAGFQVDDVLEISFEPNQIILKKIDEKERKEIEKYNLKQKIDQQQKIVSELQEKYNKI